MADLNFENRTLYHGDNLDFLRGMNSETVHLIATDPPFNKNRDFHATPDSLARGARFQDRWSWQDDIHDEWLIEIQRDYPEVWSVITTAKQVYGDDMGAFLCFMGVRLLEMRRVLREDGSLYLHCDPTASHYLKSLLDAIFGKGNFRNEIVWKRQSSNNAVTKRYGQIVDYILFYAKSETTIWNQVYHTLSSAELREYRKDKEGRYYKTDDLTAPGASPNRQFVWRGAKPSASRSWAYDKATLEKMLSGGRIELGRTGNAKLRGRITYLDDNLGQKAQSVWTDIYRIGNTANERTGYPTQKPLALYERIIGASSNPGDIVLDPFCGCATTPIAAERLGRQWVGMDIWDGALDAVRQRMADNRQLIADPDPQIHYVTKPPVRTDSGEAAVLTLRTPTGRARQRYTPPRQQHGRLLLDVGAFCQGCGRDYNFDPRVLEVDHIRPKSDGGSDAYDNLTLLCPPCNKAKLDRMTLTGLQEQNRRDGYLLSENEQNLRIGRARRSGRRRR